MLLVTQARDLALQVVYLLVSVVLIRLELLAKCQLFLKIVLKLIGHLRSTIPVGLQPAQLLHALLARHVGIRDRALDIDVTVALAIDIDLQAAI